MSSSPEGRAPSLVSVVLCSHNGARTLEEQLAALARQNYTGAWDLVFVDDGSTDESVALARQWSDRLPLRVVQAGPPGEPVGLACARNVGGWAARGEVLLFCDDDDVADEGWIAAMAAASRSSAAFGGHNEEQLLNDLGVREWRYPLTPGRLPIAFGVAKAPVGNNSGVWKYAFQAVDGFDPEFSEFSCGEEVDFFWRLQQAGYEVRYAADAVMHIRHRGSLKGLVRQSYRYGFANAVLFRRYRHLGLQRTSARETLAVVAKIVRGLPKALASGAKRGAWLRMTSYAYGQAAGSVRNRVWHLD
jgi:glycosyltransferase involved in cell wall biosynthesis